jgi:drug/metabolite transporter (DMT)-like permease
MLDGDRGQGGLVRPLIDRTGSWLAAARNGTYPGLAGVAGAVCIAFSAPLVALSRADAETATFWRCVLALPVLVVLGLVERRRRDGRPWRDRAVAMAAGALLGGDLLLWSQAIGEVGAGMATVVVNLQVVLVPLIARVADHEPLTRRFALAVPPMLVGVAMTAGVGVAAFGRDPVLGTVHASLAAVCYAGYLYLLRRGGLTGQLIGPMVDVTVAAAVVAIVTGVLGRGIDLAPGWGGFGWLLALALSGQVAGWLLIAMALPRLPSRIGAALLVLQPVGAVLLAVVLLAEVPTPIQLVGCVLVLAAVLVTIADRGAGRSGRRRRRRDHR